MLADLLKDVVGQAVFELTFYWVGRMTIWAASLGRWHCLPALSTVPKGTTRLGGLLHRRADGIYFTPGGTAAVGGLACAIIGALVLLLWLSPHH